MPVTARLSKLFYERFGEQLTNELVDWFNAVDATYRADLRDLNELNFARFDAKLEQRLAQFDAKLEQRLAQLDAKIDTRIAGVNARIDALEARFEARFRQLEDRFDHLEASVAERLDGVATKADLANLRADMLRWMFLFWTGTALGGLLLRML